MTTRILIGDCIEQMRGLVSGSVDAVVTDPPYGLVGNSRGGSSQPGDLNTPYGRSGPSKKRGFMGKEWDGSGIENNVDMWKECFRVLKPGGHLLSFGGSRTYHRMACAIEDAGFEIRDQIMWVYGSGFPKSYNISKSIDKRRVGNDVIRPWLESLGNREELSYAAEVTPRQIDHYLGQNKTPCPQTLPFNRFEKLCLYFNVMPDWSEQMYPKKGEKIREIRHSRSGGNDFAKIPGSQSVSKVVDEHAFATNEAKQWHGFGTALKPAHEPICLARKPLTGTVAENVLKHGCGGLNIDGCRIPLNGGYKCKANGRPSQTGLGDNYDPEAANMADEQGRWPANFCHDGSDEVLQLFPNSSGQAGIVKGTEPSQTGGDGTACYGKYGRVAADKRGDLGSAARFFFCAKASKQDRNSGGVKSNHPTVKPHNLMRWLCRLITPPGGTILDPFMGSGSTGKAAIKEGFSFVGIELDPEYAEIARKRIEAVKYIPKAKVLPRYREQDEVRRKPEQMELF